LKKKTNSTTILNKKEIKKNRNQIWQTKKLKENEVENKIKFEKLIEIKQKGIKKMIKSKEK